MADAGRTNGAGRMTDNANDRAPVPPIRDVPDSDLYDDRDVADADDLMDDDDGPDDDGPAGVERKRRRLFRRKGPHEHRERLSETLEKIAASEHRDRISVNELIYLLRGRAIAALLLLFAFPNALPSPPGTSGVLGLPLVYLSVQMMLGRPPWLPAFIGNRSVAREDFAAIIRRSAPYLARAERLLRPRLMSLTSPLGLRMVGMACLILSTVLILPIPLGNMLPAFAICVLALGALERDGVWIIGGTLVGILSLFVVWGVIMAFIKAILFIFSGSPG